MADDVKPETPPDLNKLVADAVAKHGDQTSTLKAFAADLYAAKDDNAKLRAQLPGAGSVVLTGDDAKRWGQLNALDPTAVRKVAEEHAELAKENAGLKRDATLRDVAERAKVSFAVLKRIAPADAEFVEVKGKDKAGKETVGVGVKLPDAAAVPFDEFPGFKDFLRSLRPDAQQAETSRPPGTPPRHDGYRPPGSGGTGGTLTQATAPADAGTRVLAAAKSSF